MSKIVDNNIDYLKDVYDWFSVTLQIVLPDSPITSSYLTDLEFEQNVQELINLFDVGIDGIELKDFTAPPSTDQIATFRSLFGNKSQDVTLFMPEDAMVMFLPSGKEARPAHLMSKHFIRSEGLRVNFPLTQESDGTRRLIELSLALMGLLTSNKDQVLVIDELDLRLHPHMTKNILEIFLANSVEKRSQLIATTHEAGLLDLELLRRDEIWFIEKDKDGASTVYSLEEFVPSYNTDIATGYLQGRFGAIPIVPSYNILDWAN